MKQFSSVVAKIKNKDGKYESIPALRGMSSYEVAKEAGFTGTEQEWLEFMFDDGWVAKFQELEANKANKTETYTKNETLSDDTKGLFGLTSTGTPDEVFSVLDDRVKEAKNYQLPWNVDENVGFINLDADGFTINSSHALGEAKAQIVSINSGEVYFYFNLGDIDTTISAAPENPEVSIYVNDNLIQTYKDGDIVRNRGFDTLLSLTKGDVITITGQCEPPASYPNNTSYVRIASIGLKANIETPYTYLNLNQTLEKSTTEEILDALLGVDE